MFARYRVDTANLCMIALFSPLLPHNLQVGDVHLLRKATPIALVAPFTKRASVPKVTDPVLALVAVATRHLPRKCLQSVQLVYVESCCKMGFRAWVRRPGAMAAQVKTIAYLELASLVDKRSYPIYPRVNSLTPTVAGNELRCSIAWSGFALGRVAHTSHQRGVCPRLFYLTTFRSVMCISREKRQFLPLVHLPL